jgi:RecA/RadA recombinase
MIGGRPIIFAATNHLKMFTDRNGYPQRNLPGGKSLKFMESLELELQRVGEIKTNTKTGLKIKIKAFKNCVGDSKRSIVVPFVWEYDDSDPTLGLSVNMRQQWTMWDWCTASINLLLAIKAKDKARWEKIEEIVDIRPKRADSETSEVWSNVLGVASSEAVSRHILGCMLEERPDLLERLYRVLDIRQGRFFRAGMNYQEMQAEDDAMPDSPALRVFRRPVCGNLANRLASGELAVDEDNGAGFDVDD